MRGFVANCEVDDDVIDVDPTVGALQDLIAEMTGKNTDFHAIRNDDQSNWPEVHCRRR